MTDESRYESSTNRSGSGSPGRSPARSPSCEQGLAALPTCTEVTNQTFQIEEQLNALFEKRLHEINEEANGDALLKERTYKEWIAMLKDINKTFINNIHEIENETSERLALLQRRAGTNCRYSQDSELFKCRKDIAALIELVRKGRQYGDWNVDKFKFETLTERDIFGDSAFSNTLMRDDIRNDCNKPSSNADPKSCASQKSKLVANVKALAYEVADKHDEIRELKKQILSMEDEIQKAQKKIQLKDDVIRELRSDLKSLPKCNQVCGPRILDRTTSNIGCNEICGTEGSSTPRAGSVYSNRGSMDMVFGLNLGEDEDDGEDYVMRLKDELNQFFEMKQAYDQNIEEQGRELKEQQDRLSDMVDKLLKKNNCYQMKLRLYRHELLNLEIPQTTSTFTFCSDKDSGINSTDSDTDLKILSTVRNRITCLNEEIVRLKKEEECLQIKYKEANSKYLAKSMLLEKNSQALREVVDTLSQAICSPIAYEIIFSEKTSSTKNPIVDALDVLIQSFREKDITINELRKQISSTNHANEELESDCHNLKSELCNLKQSVSQIEIHGMLLQNQEFSKRMLKQAENYREENLGTQQENQSEYLRIIDDLSTELNTLSHQVNMVQNEFLTDEISKQFENSMKGLETQNDLLQAAIESLIEERQSIEHTLQTQNEDLKSRLCKQEEELYDLRQQIDQLQQKVQQPCAKCSSKLSKVDDGLEHGLMRRNTPRAEEEIQRLNRELRRRTNAIEDLKTENARLTGELTEIRRNQTKPLQRRNAEANSNDAELIAKLNAAEEKNAELTKSLQKATKEIHCLNRENEAMRLNQELFSEERNLLKNELIALKENQASQVGVQQSLQEQLELTMQDFYVAKKSQYECKQSMEHLEAQYRSELKRHKDFRDKYNELVDDRNRLLREYQKVAEIEQEKTSEIVAFHAWKDEQIHKEKETRKIIKMFEEHIKYLLENQQILLKGLNDIADDNHILVQVMEQSSNLSRDVSIGYAGLAPVSSTNPVSKQIENIRNASRRLSQQRAILEDDARRLFSK